MSIFKNDLLKIKLNSDNNLNKTDINFVNKERLPSLERINKNKNFKGKYEKTKLLNISSLIKNRQKDNISDYSIIKNHTISKNKLNTDKVINLKKGSIINKNMKNTYKVDKNENKFKSTIIYYNNIEFGKEYNTSKYNIKNKKKNINSRFNIYTSVSTISDIYKNREFLKLKPVLNTNLKLFITSFSELNNKYKNKNMKIY